MIPGSARHRQRICGASESGVVIEPLTRQELKIVRIQQACARRLVFFGGSRYIFSWPTLQRPAIMKSDDAKTKGGQEIRKKPLKLYRSYPPCLISRPELLLV
jgi:hypothetical protein